MKTYGYIRVSTADQNEDRQLHAMQELKIPQKRIFTDKLSGKNFDRPAYQELVKSLKMGDLLYVKSIDRLGRNYEEILSQWRTITKEVGADIVVIDMPISDTRANHGNELIGRVICDVVLQLLSFVSEKERSDIRQRQAEGIKAARKRGVRFGRPVKKPPADFAEVVRLWERGKLMTKEAVEQSGLTESTFYRRYREYRRGKGK